LVIRTRAATLLSWSGTLAEKGKHMSGFHIRLQAAGVLLAGLLSLANAQPGTDAQHPLVVDERSRVAVMEYEAWFGPNGVTFQYSAARPWLQSADMAPLGGGYDSADPAVIRQHVKWLEWMGMDAVIADLTNDVSCIFNSEWFVEKYLKNVGSCPILRSDYQSIRDNTGNLYPAWSMLGTRLKIIPQLGGVDENELYLDADGRTAFEKEIEYFGELMMKYPELSVIYEGKPLMLVYVGAAQDPSTGDNPLWYQFREFLVMHPEIADKYTFRQVAGYLDSQPYLWKNPNQAVGPREVAPEYGLWSWVDRLKTSCSNPSCPYYPSYNRRGDRVENFTASIATAGQTGWGCPDPDKKPYCEDDALRWAKGDKYDTFESFMRFARELDPLFLIVHQFNEFVMPDEGFDANTDDDIEPANLWDATALGPVREQVRLYHRGKCEAEGSWASADQSQYQDPCPGQTR
jgi:hypothetical protein